MKRATMTLPDDLARAVDEYVQAQEAPPALTTVMQSRSAGVPGRNADSCGRTVHLKIDSR